MSTVTIGSVWESKIMRGKRCVVVGFTDYKMIRHVIYDTGDEKFPHLRIRTLSRFHEMYRHPRTVKDVPRP